MLNVFVVWIVLPFMFFLLVAIEANEAMHNSATNSQVTSYLYVT